MSTTNINGRLIETVPGVGSVRESAEVYEIYACQRCNARRVWGTATVLGGDYVPPVHAPTLRCEGACQDTLNRPISTPHAFVGVRTLIATRHFGVGPAGDAKLQSVRWRSANGGAL